MNDVYVQSGHLEFAVIDDESVEMEVYDRVSPDLVAETPAGFGVSEWESARTTDGS